MSKTIRPQGGLGPTLVGAASRESARHAQTYWAKVVSVGRETVDVLPDDHSGLQQRIPVSGGPARRGQRVLITSVNGIATAQIPGLASGESVATPSIQSVGAIGAGGASPGPIAQHDLDGPYHLGLLGDAQAPQFLLLDGTREMTGPLALQEVDFHQGDDAIVATETYIGAGGYHGLRVEVPPITGDQSEIDLLTNADSGDTADVFLRALTTGEDTASVEMFSGASGSYVEIVAPVTNIVGGNLDMGTYNIVDMADPVDPQDAATKAYVDAAAGGGGSSFEMDRPRIAYQAFNTPVMIGDSGSGGAQGAVPAPAAGDAAAGKFLKANGAWATVSGASGGTVTSVGLTMPSDFTVSGSPVTSSGTIAVTGGTNFLVAQVFS